MATVNMERRPIHAACYFVQTTIAWVGTIVSTGRRNVQDSTSTRQAAIHNESCLVDVSVRLLADGKVCRRQRKYYTGSTSKLLSLWKKLYSEGNRTCRRLLRACARMYGQVPVSTKSDYNGELQHVDSSVVFTHAVVYSP